MKGEVVIDDVKATDAAKFLAEEQGVDLASVQASGADGQVTKPDVEAYLAELESDDSAPGASLDKIIYAEFNPRLAPMERLVLTNGEGFERVFTDDPNTRIMSESELEDFNRNQVDGLKPLRKGREA